MSSDEEEITHDSRHGHRGRVIGEDMADVAGGTSPAATGSEDGELLRTIDDINTNGTYFDLFNIPENANLDTINDAYERVASIVLRSAGHAKQAECMQKICNAIGTLKVEESRISYVHKLREERRLATKLVIWKITSPISERGTELIKVGQIGPDWVFNSTSANDKLQNDRENFMNDMNYLNIISKSIELCDVIIHDRAKVHYWMPAKSIGFATNLVSGQQVFVHPKNYYSSDTTLEKSCIVEYSHTQDEPVSHQSKRSRTDHGLRKAQNQLPTALNVKRIFGEEPTSGHTFITSSGQVHSGVMIMLLLQHCGGTYNGNPKVSILRQAGFECIDPRCQYIITPETLQM